jgi:hypothetical protein
VELSRRRWPKVEQDDGIGDVAFLIMEWLGEQGVHVMIRIDAERLFAGEPAWTFVANGGPLPHVVRTDGTTVQRCVSLAVA